MSATNMHKNSTIYLIQYCVHRIVTFRSTSFCQIIKSTWDAVMYIEKITKYRTIPYSSASSGKIFFIRTRKMRIFDFKVKFWRLLSLTQWFCIVISAVICALYICTYVQWPIEPNCYGGRTVQLFFYTAFIVYMSAFCQCICRIQFSKTFTLKELSHEYLFSKGCQLLLSNVVTSAQVAVTEPLQVPESQCPY
jgi:hypothetical protein